jgi:DNA excision repair protein ERCC-2
MKADARAGFLARFRPQGQGIGFAVLGGVFAEGVDLPGRCWSAPSSPRWACRRSR